MNAVVQAGYGTADVLELRKIEKPGPGEGEVLVRVLAASLSAGDYFGMRGTPFPARLTVGFPKPKQDHVVGLDCAGVVESVGANVTRFQPGDEVTAVCSTGNVQMARSTTGGDLEVLGELIGAGKVTPVIDRSYPLSETPQAFRYLDEGHARGKVVITVEHEHA